MFAETLIIIPIFFNIFCSFITFYRSNDKTFILKIFHQTGDVKFGHFGFNELIVFKFNRKGIQIIFFSNYVLCWSIKKVSYFRIFKWCIIRFCFFNKIDQIVFLHFNCEWYLQWRQFILYYNYWTQKNKFINLKMKILSNI